MRFFLSQLLLAMLLFSLNMSAQEPLFTFGEEIQWSDINTGNSTNAKPIKWFQVNTDEETWRIEDDILISTGLPIGVVRSEKEYENFIMHIEWKHMEAGGNSGTFVWSKADPGQGRLPDGVEVQMLELDWVNQSISDGVNPTIAYVHGEL